MRKVLFYINYEECKFGKRSKRRTRKISFYINYEECKSLIVEAKNINVKSFILTMRNVNMFQEHH